MIFYILRRIVATIPVMGVVALLVFSLLYLAPGDPAVIIAGESASTEQLEKMRKDMGLDQPLPVQFAKWIGKVATGDLGTSLHSGKKFRR